MAYQMAQLPMTFQRLKITFAVLNLCNTHNLRNVEYFNSLCLCITWKVHTACDLNIIDKG